MDSSTPYEYYYSIIKIALAIMLIILNGLFVAAEFAFVRVRPTRISQLAAEGNRKAASTHYILENITAFLSVSQLGITLVSLGLGWLGEPAVATLIRPIFFRWGIFSDTLVTTLALIIAFSIITFMHVVFGELVPKWMSIEHTEKYALLLSAPMRFFYVIFYPAATLLNISARQVISLFGYQAASHNEITHSEEELRMIISESYHGGQINETEQELLQNVFRFEERVAEEIMVPRPDVIFLNTNQNLKFNLELARSSEHTRYPLCDGSPDKVIGLIHIKDLLFLDESIEHIAQIKRDIMYIPQGMPLDQLLAELRTRHQHLAVVVDEYGGTAGIVSMEDILEELVGEIQDEFDEEEPELIANEDGTWLAQGLVLIDELAEQFDLTLDEDDEPYNTLGGYVFGKLGKRPREGDFIKVGNIKMEVVKVKGLRIEWIRIHKIENKPVDMDVKSND